LGVGGGNGYLARDELEELVKMALKEEMESG
jgi:hypothetical protein